MKLRNLFKRPALVQLNSLGEQVTPLISLKYRAITVSYQPGFIPGIRMVKLKSEAFTSRAQYDKQAFVVERPARVKVWQVAVKTVEPDVVFPEHSGWMLHILHERAEIVRTSALRENLAIQRDAMLYYQSVKNVDLYAVPNTPLPNN